MKNVNVLIVGILFGIILAKSEVIALFRIHRMFRFEEPYMYLVIGSAIVVAFISVSIIKRFQVKTVAGEQIVINNKPYHKGVVFGGLLYGAGWTISGSCPGPVYAQLGGGEYLGVVTLLGAIAGVYIYSYLRPKLPH